MRCAIAERASTSPIPNDETRMTNQFRNQNDELAAPLGRKDLAVQGKYGVEITDYWHSEKDGAVFCLAEAPTKEAFGAVHREAHGLEADEIFEVKQGEK